MPGEPESAPPASLHRMLEAAERIAAEFDFARVDFYEVDGQPRFGEVTFYPGSGLDPFDPPQLDLAMGALWLSARSRATNPAPNEVNGPLPSAA